MRRVIGLLLGLGASACPASALADDVMEGHARRGAVYVRILMEDLTPTACSALCNGDGQCQSWVWTRAELTGTDPACHLLSAAPTPYRAPGRVTGLSSQLSDRIEAAAERAPSPREEVALRATVRGPY
ncbi:PAN domain-containing protein [Maricaulis maris]|uniref:PAN domain-containing protein n=1 Tax=Maricaulis maris TaxID=74318 RepID=UPI003B8ADD2C